METQNKQWVCPPVLDNSGQMGPEDLSSTNKSLQNRSIINDKHKNNSSKEQQVIPDLQNKNGLDQLNVQQVEDAICENSRQVVLRILDEVARLNTIEKLLLYLKLPSDMNNVTDPLRQPLNPLGGRTEISQTIMWIRTHLEEDPELSLPKQEVYNEYTVHCANNKMKPLSTADFGKVMKQVYCNVRPRRLGTRGNSRYCYAGLRKRFKLEVPQLPDLGDKPQSTETLCTQNELTNAACTIVCEWAESIIGTHFQSVYVLASYLIRHAPQNVTLNSGAAALLAGYSEGIHSKDGLSQELLPYSNHVNLKHKEAQLQLQRKLQQREFKRKLQMQSPKSETKSKCKKSKLQGSGSGPPTRSVSLDSVGNESPKSQGYPLNTVCDNPTNECITAPTLPDFSSFHVKKSMQEVASDKPTVIKKDGAETNKINPVGSAHVSRSNSLENEMLEQPEEIMPDLKPNLAGKLPIPRLPSHKMKPSILPPKSVILQAPASKKSHQRNQKYKAIQPKPAKCDTQGGATQGNGEATGTMDAPEVIQLAPDDSLKNADYLTRERLISVSNVDKDALDDYLHGGNNSQEQEEELMQYFKNNNNSTNNDGYAQTNQTASQLEPDELSNSSKSDKLSQLRLLLEQNLNANAVAGVQQGPAVPMNVTKNITGLSINTASSSAFIKAKHGAFVPSSVDMNMLSQNLALQSHLNSAVKRRVSFETSVVDNDTVPPSPNTRRKNFSFTPISPGPHSPGGGRQSKCSSTNASPFVSPRNTPVPRAKASSHVQPQVPTSFVAQQVVPPATRKHPSIIKPTLKTTLKHEPEMYVETEKMFGDLIEEKHFVNPTDIMPKCNLPMSAPPSPMLPYKQKMNNNSNLLQKLLDSNSKVSYVPDYDKSVQQNMANQTVNMDPLSQEVSQLLSENNSQSYNPIENSYRSQSVPLNQMNSFKTLMSPCMPNSQQTHFSFNFTSANNSVAPTPVPNEFTDFEAFSEINTGLNNENLNQILNILETTQPNSTDEATSAQPLSATNSASQAVENVFTFDTGAANILNQEMLNQTSATVGSQIQTQDLISVQKLIRSQSIDIDMEMRGICPGPKYIQPSRSVPSTPLPYTKSKLQLDLNLNNNQNDVPQTIDGNVFGCRPISNQDFLLNGQPVKDKYHFDQTNENANMEMPTESQNFPPSLGFTMNDPMSNDNKINNFSSNSVENYGARRNINPLLEQQYHETDEFNTAVPRINSGTP